MNRIPNIMLLLPVILLLAMSCNSWQDGAHGMPEIEDEPGLAASGMEAGSCPAVRLQAERLAEAVAKWKAEQPLKQPKDKKDSDPQEDTDRQPVQGKPKRTLMSLIQDAQQQQAPAQGGLIMQIMSYQLSQHTPAENYEFIQRLQQQIASIL